jgi:hypothetical protein
LDPNLVVSETLKKIYETTFKNYLFTSVPDPCHFGVDPAPAPDPRIHASELWIRILDPDPAIFVIDLQDANKKLLFSLLITF